jgi:predicted DNA-binding transcriptional regulator YafY
VSTQAKRDRTARLLRVAQTLHQYPGGLRARRLAEICEVSVRTVYRDLGALQGELGYPIWGEGGRYGLEEGVFLPPLKLNLPEAMTLFLAARLVSRYSDERDPNVQSSFTKIAAALPRAVAQHVCDTVAAMATRAENPTYARVFDILTAAWATGRRVRIWYPWTGGGVSRVYERLVEPYFLEPSPIGHSCYLIAHCHHSGALRTFKLERIREIELTDQPYTIPPDFNANSYLRSSWGVVADEEVEVQLRFSPAVAARVQECSWHPSQSVTGRDDGGVDFTATVAGTMEITPWILGWGAEVEVLGPAELRARVAEIAARTIAQYL